MSLLSYFHEYPISTEMLSSYKIRLRIIFYQSNFMNPILTQGFGHKLLKSNSMVWENIRLNVLFGYLSVFGNAKSLLICFRELFNAGERIFQFVLLFKRYKTCFVTCSFSFHKKLQYFVACIVVP